VKLLYAIAFALFPSAAPAQTPDSSGLSAPCQDNYYEDTSGDCSGISAGEVLSIEAIFERAGAVVITRDEGEEIADAFLADSEDIPVGSIDPPSGIPAAELAILTDENSGTDSAIELETVASHTVAPEAQLQASTEGEDEIVATGPTAPRIPTIATDPVPNSLAVE
jgi:hypothetical protein